MSKLERINKRINHIEQQLKELKKQRKKEEEAICLIIGDAMFNALNSGDPYMTKLILEQTPKSIESHKGEKKRVLEKIYQTVLHNCVLPAEARIKL